MADFENYPRYQLDKYGNEIKIILKNAAEFYGMQVSADKADELKGVEFASHPSMRNTIGGAEHLRKGTGEDGAKVLFDDQFSTAADHNQNTVVYYEHTSASDETVITKTPLAIGDFTTTEQIREMFKAVNSEASVLPKLTTPITLFADDTIYSYTDMRTETTQELTRDFIARATEGIQFNIKTTSYQGLEDGVAGDTTSLYANSISNKLLQAALPASIPGTQVIKTIHLGDDFAYATSEESKAVYRATLGLPAVALRNATLTANVKIADLSLPIVERGDLGLYPEETGIVIFNDDGSIKEDFRSITYQHYHYKYSTGELLSITGENGLEGITLRQGDFLKAKINFDTEAWQNALAYQGPFNNSSDVITVDTTEQELIVTNFKKYPQPAAVIYNPENSLVYCFHATSITGNTALPKQLSFVYKIERPDTDENYNTVWVTVSQGVTDSKIDYNNSAITATPAAFFLRKGDRLTLKSRAQYYDDSDAYVFELTDEIINTPAPSGIFYQWSLDSYSKDQIIVNPMAPESDNPGDKTTIQAFVDIEELVKKSSESSVWGTLFTGDLVNKFTDDSGKALYLTQPISVDTEYTAIPWDNSFELYNVDRVEKYAKDNYDEFTTKEEFAIANNIGFVSDRAASKETYLQFVANTFETTIDLGNGIRYTPKTYTAIDVSQPYYEPVTDDMVRAMIRKYSLIMSDEKDIQTGIHYSVLEKMLKEYDTRKLLLKVFPPEAGVDMDEHIKTLLTEILSEKANKVAIYDNIVVYDNSSTEPDKFTEKLIVENHVLTKLIYNGATYNLTKESPVTSLEPTPLDYFTGIYKATHIENNSSFKINVTNNGIITFSVPGLKYPLVEWLYTYNPEDQKLVIYITKEITLKDWYYIEADAEQVLKTLTYKNNKYNLIQVDSQKYEAISEDGESFEVVINENNEISFTPINEDQLIGWKIEILDAIYEEPDINTTTKEDICWLVRKYANLYYFDPSTTKEEFGLNTNKKTLVEKMLENKKVCDFIERVFADASDFTSRDAKGIVKEILFVPSTDIPSRPGFGIL